MLERLIKPLMVFLLLGVSYFSNANPVDIKDAKKIGSRFIQANTAIKEACPDDLQLVVTYKTEKNDAAFYVFNYDHGFVMVAADDCSTPVLCYSDEGQFDPENIPPQMAGYLEMYRKEIEYGIEQKLPAEESIARQWVCVKANGSLYGEGTSNAVQPLLTTTWSQGCFYNELCPEDSLGQCGHVWTGCVATAMAQIMNYWACPKTGTGSFSYTPYPYPTQYVNFGNTHYDWMNMPKELDFSSTGTEVNAVATLLWHCGVSVGMWYSPNGSGAFSDAPLYSWINYFKFSDEMYYEYKGDDATWLALIKGNLDLGWPVYYGGSGNTSGHAFVCDGYNSNNQLHFNWGWGGVGDGYYSLNALNVQNGSQLQQYNNDNHAIFNIHPQNLGERCTISTNTNPSVGGIVTGAGSYYEGMICTLKTRPGYDYVFKNWTKNGVVVSTNPVYKFVVSENATYIANFDLFDGVSIGEVDTITHTHLPSDSHSCFSLSEQIYTSEEIGTSGAITSLAFYNDGAEENRDYDIYMVHTNKNAFNYYADWIAVEEEDLVFRGPVRIETGVWTTIVLDTPFIYDGSHNLALVVNDVTGDFTAMPVMTCRVFNTADAQAMHDFDYFSSFNPSNPTSYFGTVCNEKNQIRFTKVDINSTDALINLYPGWNWISYTIFEEKNLADALGVFVPVEGDIIKSPNAYSDYENGHWIGSLSKFSPGVGYLYYSNRGVVTPFSFVSSASTSTGSINLNPGWNWISYTLFEEKGLIEALGSFVPAEGDIIKSPNSFSDYENGHWVGSFTHFTPGKGFIYYSNRPNTVPLSFEATPSSPGYINGAFTVNAEGGQVYFSQGNLQYQASTNTWRFAEHQFDFVGAGNSNISSSYDGWIDLYCWGTSGYSHGAYGYQPWSNIQSNTDYYAYGCSNCNLYDGSGQADWGYNAISNGGNQENSGWRTLKVEEWDYVFNTRNTSSGIRYAKGRVDGTNGIILLPDQWNAVTYTLSNVNQSEASYTSNVINANQWTVLENAGAVFLPAAGRRYGTTVDEYDLGRRGHYWSSSSSNYHFFSYAVYFTNSDLDPFFDHYRYIAKSVRLVRDVE